MVTNGSKFHEGDWIAVPLRGGGYALGLLARLQGKDTGLGYFFGPKVDAVPSGQGIAQLRPEDAVLVTKFGTVGIARGDWKVVFAAQPWKREEWPIPAFRRTEPFTNRILKVIYAEGNLLTPAAELPISPDESADYPEDGSFGMGALEIRLTRLLANG